MTALMLPVGKRNSNSVAAYSLRSDNGSYGIIKPGHSYVLHRLVDFFGMNEYGEIVTWRLTKTTGFNEIEDLLVDLRQRLEDNGIELETIILDDCCKMRNLYQNIFGKNVDIKLDIFHACQRIVHTLDNDDIKKQFSKEFGLIFRKDGDVSEERERGTPESDVIIGNLEQLLCRWQGQLNAKTLKAIDDLRKHINKGCLSNILPGEGTGKNERFHRHLRRSLLVGASTISPELAVACLTLALYVWNNKRKNLKHYKNQRVIPITPPECLRSISENGASSTSVPLCVNRGIPSEVPNQFTQTQATSATPLENWLRSANDVKMIICNANLIQELHNNCIVAYIIQKTLQLQEIIQRMNNQCTLRGLDFKYFPLSDIESHAKLIISCSTQSNFAGVTSTIEMGKNAETLRRNLKSFNLDIDAVVGDGNCCFHSITLQLHKMFLSALRDDSHAANKEYFDNLRSMGLGKSPVEDAATLREMFVKELEANTEEYGNWIDLHEQQFLTEINYMREKGTFNSNLADLCLKVCCDVLGLPIIVITSYPSAPHFTFIPNEIKHPCTSTLRRV